MICVRRLQRCGTKKPASIVSSGRVARAAKSCVPETTRRVPRRARLVVHTDESARTVIASSRSSSRPSGRRRPPASGRRTDDGVLDHLDAGDEGGRAVGERGREQPEGKGERGARQQPVAATGCDELVAADGDEDDSEPRQAMSPGAMSTVVPARPKPARGWSVVRTRASAVVSRSAANGKRPAACCRGRPGRTSAYDTRSPPRP